MALSQDPLPKSTKTARFETRLTPEQKELLQQAAAYENCKMAEFASRAIQEAAEKVLIKHHYLQLNQQDSQTFAQALLQPPEPSQALKDAFVFYQDTLSQ